MLSIGAMGSGQGNYYLSLAREDYYLNGGEPPGKWLGEGARVLGLHATVDKAALRHLLQGNSPTGTRPLIQNAGSARHQPGWDLTFSAPKSVSVLWGLSESDTREVIQEAHHQAVATALAYLEQEAGFTRRGKGGETRERAGLIVAAFEHGTSRLLDPQLHTHALVLNVGMRRDGTSGTVESKPFYEHKMTAGALYRVELAAQLERHLGVKCEREGAWFAVAGLPKTLSETFSKRRGEIETFLQERALSGASASAYATLATRAAKGDVARSALFPAWKTVGEQEGFGPKELHAVLSRRPERREASQERASVEEAVLARLTAEKNVFGRRECLRTFAEEAQDHGLDAQSVLDGATALLRDPGRIVPLETGTGPERYTTRETERLAQQIQEALARSGEQGRHRLYLPSVWAGIRVAQREDRAHLGEAERDTLHRITRAKGSIQVVEGVSGTDKATLLKAARIAWEREGYKVMGVTSTARGASGLTQDTGIRAFTFASFFHITERGLLDTLKHHVRQLARAALHKPTFAYTALLDKNTVIVLDHAQRASLQNMAALVAAVEKSGAKLILVDDARRHEPLGEAKAATSTSAEAAPTRFPERAHVCYFPDRNAARAQCLAEWQREGIRCPEQNLLLATTREETHSLNKDAQRLRQEAGALGALHVQVGEERFHSGDRVQFTHAARLYGIKAGSMATITLVEPLTRTLALRLDDGRFVTLPLHRFQHLQLGYAVRVDQGAGAVVENTFFVGKASGSTNGALLEHASQTQNRLRIYAEERGHQEQTLHNENRFTPRAPASRTVSPLRHVRTL